MSAPLCNSNEPPEPGQIREMHIKRIQALIHTRVAHASAAEQLDIYEGFLTLIWQHIQPTLGRFTVEVIVDRALTITRGDYPALRAVQVQHNGVDLSGLRQGLAETDPAMIEAAQQCLIANLLQILTMLTGDILIHQLIERLEECEGHDG